MAPHGGPDLVTIRELRTHITGLRQQVTSPDRRKAYNDEGYGNK
jgi:hypothetical protein